MDTVRFIPDMLISDLFDRCPATITVFIKRRMGCVGCLMSSFDTIQEAAQNYHIPLEDLLLELELQAKSDAQV